MKPELESLRRQLEASSSEVRWLAAELDETRWQTSPRQGAWSAGECIAHLNETNRKYSAAIRDTVESGSAERWAGTSFRYGMLERWFVNSLEPPPKMKVSAPKLFVPDGVSSRDEAMAEWNRIHLELIALLERSDGLHLSRDKVVSPVSRFLKLSLGISFALVAAHNRRHIYQAKRTSEEAKCTSGEDSTHAAGSQ
jgi:hypothetical protein